MNADRAIRAVTVAAVGLVAAVLSFRHQYELAATHGESQLTARLLPLSIDGLLSADTSPSSTRPAAAAAGHGRRVPPSR